MDVGERSDISLREGARIRGFASISPERLAAIFAIMAIIVVLCATWFGQEIALIDSSCSAAESCVSFFGR
jgi:hypothetical protein